VLQDLNDVNHGERSPCHSVALLASGTRASVDGTGDQDGDTPDPRPTGELLDGRGGELIDGTTPPVGNSVTAHTWRGVGQFRGDAAFGTWLHRIVVRACLHHLRDRRAPEVIEGLAAAERRFLDPDYTVEFPRASRSRDPRSKARLIPVGSTYKGGSWHR